MLDIRFEKYRNYPHVIDSEEEARRIGQIEKNRVIAKARKLHLTPTESLIIGDMPIMGTNPGHNMTEVLFDSRGITISEVKSTAGTNGEQMRVRRAMEIPLRDYPKYGELIDAAIQRIPQRNI